MTTHPGNAAPFLKLRPSHGFQKLSHLLSQLARSEKDPPKRAIWPDGIYFNPTYLVLPEGKKTGPLKQTETAIHECAHFVHNDTIEAPVRQNLSWAHGYSGYVRHCAFGRSSPFAETE